MTLSGKAAVAGVMGWPVSHSKSPRLHGYWIAEHDVDGAYVPFAVPPDRLEQALRALPVLGLRGVNLTVPHKETALALVDDSDPVAARIGAVNTVFVDPDGRLRATNTDAAGFIENLHHGAPDWHNAEGAAVVLGAGGAARAVVTALTDAGIGEVRVVNRTQAKAENIKAAFGPAVKTLDWSECADALGGAALLVNTTTLGMTGQPPLDLPLDDLSTEAVVTDLVYAPLDTPLLAAARARGNRTVDGLGMLLHQAVPGFEGWFGVRPTVSQALRAHVLADD